MLEQIIFAIVEGLPTNNNYWRDNHYTSLDD